jgi:DNA-directed RNA polymerase subunit M/transcription elongation factor TFIIS
MDEVDKYLAFVKAYRAVITSKCVVINEENVHMTMCHVCSNISVVSELTQKRAADEEATNVEWCIVCGK